MAKYSVYFRPSGSFGVTIEVPDSEVPEDETELVDRLIDEAFDAVPTGVCAQCGGWGQNWWLDFSDSEVQFIESPSGETIYEDKLPA